MLSTHQIPDLGNASGGISIKSTQYPGRHIEGGFFLRFHEGSDLNGKNTRQPHKHCWS